MSIKKIALASAAVAMTIGTVGTTANASVLDQPFFKVLGTVVVWSDATSGTTPVVHDFILNTDATGDNDLDLIGGNAVDGNALVTGELQPLDQNAAFDASAPFGTGTLDLSTALSVESDLSSAVGVYESSFYVASNTNFSIKASAANFAATGDFATSLIPSGGTAADLADNIRMSMAAVAADSASDMTHGGKSQLPYTDASVAFDGFEVADNATLDDLTTESVVFTGTQRTAADVGSIRDQSVRFDMTYTMQDDPASAGVAGSGYDMSMGFGTLEAEVTYTVFVP